MARRQKRKRGAQQSRTGMPDSVTQTRRLLEALDGYSNAAAFLGENSPLISAGIIYGIGLLVLCWVFRIEEAMLVWGRILHRKKRSS